MAVDTKVFKLNNGTVIRDNRSLGCGVSIENGEKRFLSLTFSTITNQFYLSLKGVWIGEEEFEQYNFELQVMQSTVREANQKITG